MESVESDFAVFLGIPLLEDLLEFFLVKFESEFFVDHEEVLDVPVILDAGHFGIEFLDFISVFVHGCFKHFCKHLPCARANLNR